MTREGTERKMISPDRDIVEDVPLGRSSARLKKYIIMSFEGERRYQMSSTYHHTNGNIIVGDGEVHISLHKLVTDNRGCSGNPCVIPLGLTEIAKFVSWM